MSAFWSWLQINEALLWWLGLGSMIMFIGTLIAVPLVIIKLPADFFAPHRDGHSSFGDRHPIIRLVLEIIKNAFGVVFLLAGIAMLVLPGQGLLTMLIGLSLLSFPGKRELERRIVQQPKMLAAINWMRQRASQPKLRFSALPTE